MENPMVSAASGITSGGLSVNGGRPPDPIIALDGTSGLTHPRSPTGFVAQPSFKKGRGVDGSSDSPGDLDVMMRDDSPDDIVELVISDPSLALSPTAKAVDGGISSPGVPSFKEKLMGAAGCIRDTVNLNVLDVEVRDEDVRIGGSSSLPEIQFSDNVHEAIDAKLANSVIVRLLGRSIGYQTLLNRIHLIWKPKGAMSLIDLDNNYFLVRFAVEEDFRNVLTNGPWTIFGSYLTVQPWSRGFSTKEEYLSQTMVWVRLPNLPYRYYTKSLFRYIAAAIGKVVRIDYNTSEAKRGRFARLAILVDLKKPLVSGIVIDGQRQDIKYEGLPEICFKCGMYGHLSDSCGAVPKKVSEDVAASVCRDPNALYGPWMQVIDRRRKIGMQKKVMGRMGSSNSGKLVHGSRFGVLLEDVDHVEVGRNHASTSETLLPMHTSNNEQPPYFKRDRQAEGNRGSDSLREVSDLDGGHAVPGNVASVGKVIAAKSSLNVAKNVAVQVLEPGMALGSHTSKGRILPNSLRSGLSKSNLKSSGINQIIKQIGTKQKKRDDRGVGKQSIASGLSKLMEDLNSAETSVTSIQGSISSGGNGDGKRGALDPTLIRSFKLLVKKQVPNIAVVMEPRISGKAADSFIRKAGFDSSYRVEARGFSGGIWVLWNDSVKLDILAVSNQYIHGFCSLVGENSSFFFTCVYASPEPLKRRILWNQLKALELASGAPWVIGGDLNVIVSSFERQGGSSSRSNICSDFGEFMMDTGLLDMGFNGPKFTWKRGTLSQRLDRFLCNSAWYDSFPSSEVFHLIKLGSDHRPILLDTGSCNIRSGFRPFRYIAAWNEHPGFNVFLKEVWSETGDVAMNIDSFRDKVRKWNTDVFGHIGRRKTTLLARIRGVE
ncbi:hypothetical protein GQ457_08G016750 [Hibiscus cannabinus]